MSVTGDKIAWLMYYGHTEEAARALAESNAPAWADMVRHERKVQRSYASKEARP